MSDVIKHSLENNGRALTIGISPGCIFLKQLKLGVRGVTRDLLLLMALYTPNQNPLKAAFYPWRVAFSPPATCPALCSAALKPGELQLFIACKRREVKGEGDFRGMYFSSGIRRAPFLAQQ